MRGLQLSLNKGQKLRLERAMEQLESFSSKANSDAFVVVAYNISVNYEDPILKGHRTTDMDGRMVATVRINKLVPGANYNLTENTKSRCPKGSKKIELSLYAGTS